MRTHPWTRWIWIAIGSVFATACGDASDSSSEPYTQQGVGGHAQGGQTGVGGTSGHGVGGIDAGNSTTGGSGGAKDGGTHTTDAATVAADCSQFEAKFTTIRDMFQASLKSNGVTAGALAMVCGGELKTAGLGTVKKGGAATTDATLFQMASITKMMTAAASVSLARDGLIDLAAPVSNILPALGYGQLTLHQILSHSSGLPTVFPNEGVSGLHNWLTNSQNVNATLWAPPGAVWYYNNAGYAVAGGLIETASGLSFASLLQQRVFSPFNMTHATMLVSEVLAGGDYAFGYSGSSSSTQALGPNDSYYGDSVYGPMGGAWASAQDMGALALALLGHHADSALFAPMMQKQIRTGFMPGMYYGYGLETDEGMRPSLVMHSGSVQGFLSDMELVPSADVGVVAMVNSDWYFPGDVTSAALEAFVTFENIRPESPPASSRWPLLVGTYQSAVFGKVVVSIKNSKLQAQLVDQGKTTDLVEDTYSGYDNYSFKWTDPYEGEIDAPVTFWIEGSEPAQYMVSPYGVGTRK